MIQYHKAEDLDNQVKEIVEKLNLTHIDPSRVVCIKSKGSQSRNVLARCHTMSRIMQKALSLEAHYIIEVISEKFDKLSKEEQTKTLIHELMHIPKSFGGGFRHHRRYVNKRTVDKMYKKLNSEKI